MWRTGIPESLWSTVFPYVDSFTFRNTSFKNGGMFRSGDSTSDDYLEDVLFPALNAYGIKTILNITCAGRAACDPCLGEGGGDENCPRSELLQVDLDIADRCAQLGALWWAFRAESIITGGINKGNCKDVYPPHGGNLPQRIADCIRAFGAFAAVYPLAYRLIADTEVAKTGPNHTDKDGNERWSYEDDYPTLIAAMIAANLPLRGFASAWAKQEMDWPELTRVVAARDWFMGQGLEWELVPGNDDNDIGNAQYQTGMIEVVSRLRELGCIPTVFTPTSWRKYPNRIGHPDCNERCPLAWLGVVKVVTNMGILTLRADNNYV